MSPTEQQLRVSLVSLGCPKNLVDSERMLADLAESGCIVGAPMEDADVVVINTCGFLSSARDESLEVIREALAHKRAGGVRRVVVAGCLPSREGAELYEHAPGIDGVIGVNNRDKIVEAVTGGGRVTLLDRLGCAVRCDDRGRFRLTPPHTAFLRIAEGCSQQCTYCTIPAIRGPLSSKAPDMVLAEAEELIADGAVELNLIAQDTTAYGMDLPSGASRADRADLAGLLRQLDRLEGVEWVRLMYTHPRRFTDELIETLAGCRRIVPYVDIPLQHICDDILRRMGRGVGRKATEGLLSRLRDRVAGLVIRTTFIVGFPGETESQFTELLEFVKEFRFDALGVFEFSPEEGTPAASMPQQVPDDVKARRAEQIMLAQQEIAFENNQSVLESPIVVLVDGTDGQGRCVGRYYGQAPQVDSLCILTEPAPAGTFVQCTVTGTDGYDLIVTPGQDTCGFGDCGSRIEHYD